MVIALVFLASLAGHLFVTVRARQLGLLTLVAWFPFWVDHVLRFRRRPIPLSRWVRYVAPPLAVLAVVLLVLSGTRGAPELEGLPVFAPRARYDFSRELDVERWRFVTVAAAFDLVWYLTLVAVTLEMALGPGSRPEPSGDETTAVAGR